MCCSVVLLVEREIRVCVVFWNEYRILQRGHYLVPAPFKPLAHSYELLEKELGCNIHWVGQEVFLAFFRTIAVVVLSCL